MFVGVCVCTHVRLNLLAYNPMPRCLYRGAVCSFMDQGVLVPAPRAEGRAGLRLKGSWD